MVILTVLGFLLACILHIFICEVRSLVAVWINIDGYEISICSNLTCFADSLRNS